MTTYKFTDSTNTVVAKIDDDGISRMSCTIENPEYLAWIAEGNEPLPADPPVRDIKAEIAQMEFTALMPRATREFMLGLMEAQFTPEQLQGNPGYTKVKAFDNSIKALRDLL